MRVSNVVDMSNQSRIKSAEAQSWPRCKRVEVGGDRVICVLDWDRTYSLARASTLDPHLDFLNLKTDEDLARFLKWWGPLFATDTDVKRDECWAYHRKLRAMGELIEAFRTSNRSRLCNALLGLFTADDECSRLSPLGRPGHLASYTARCFGRNFSEPPKNWIPQLNLRRLREAVAVVIGMMLAATSTLRAVWRDGKAQIDWQPSVITLAQLVEWCMWHDLAGKRPLVACKNCGRVFHPEYANAREFCEALCARRWTAREWARRNRRKQKRSLKALSAH
jgi:hypothetical protein